MGFRCHRGGRRYGRLHYPNGPARGNLVSHPRHSRAESNHETLTYLGSVAVVSVLTALAGLFLAARREWYWMLKLFLSVFGGMLLNVLLKVAFHRHRPTFDDPIQILTTYSFPSGHALAATLFYGTIAAFLSARFPQWPRRLSIFFAAAFLISLVAFSRIYLGVHYLSDVLGGITAGLAWLAFCLTGIETLRRIRAHSPSELSNQPSALL